MGDHGKTITVGDLKELVHDLQARVDNLVEWFDSRDEGFTLLASWQPVVLPPVPGDDAAADATGQGGDAPDGKRNGPPTHPQPICNMPGAGGCIPAPRKPGSAPKFGDLWQAARGLEIETGTLRGLLGQADRTKETDAPPRP